MIAQRSHMHIITVRASLLFYPLLPDCKSALMLQAAQQDISAEREVYQTSRSGLDTMYTEAKKQLEDETRLRIVSGSPEESNWTALSFFQTPPLFCISLSLSVNWIVFPSCSFQCCIFWFSWKGWMMSCSISPDYPVLLSLDAELWSDGVSSWMSMNVRKKKTEKHEREHPMFAVWRGTVCSRFDESLWGEWSVSTDRFCWNRNLCWCHDDAVFVLFLFCI